MREATKAHELSRRGVSTGFVGVESRIQLTSKHEHLPSDTYLPTSGSNRQEYTKSPEAERYHVNTRDSTEEGPEVLPPLRPNRRRGDDVELGTQRLTEYNLFKHNDRVSKVNPMVSNYISPIGQFFLSFLSLFLKLRS